MEILLKNNLNYIKNLEILNQDITKLEKITKTLNKDKSIIISGMIGVGKTNFIKYLLKSTGTIDSFFYLNPELDCNNNLASLDNLDKIFELYIKTYNKPKIIILENINNLPNVKDLITKIHKNSNYKLIIIGNSVKITGIKEIEITPTSIKNITEEINLSEIMNYGKLNDVLLTNNPYLKKRLLDLYKNKIILKDIIGDFSVKNTILLNQVITELSNINTCLSLRDLHKHLKSKQIDISLITTIDYINYLLSSKMLNRSYTYDFKLNKEITSKAKYYFTDNGIRNNFGLYNLDKNTLKENLIFSELFSLGYNIYNGKNGVFNFTFYGEKEDSKIFIHISEQTDKNEFSKEVRKLIKVPGKGSKFIVVTDKQIEDMKIKKFVYENVKILKLKDLIKKLP